MLITNDSSFVIQMNRKLSKPKIMSLSFSQIFDNSNGSKIEKTPQDIGVSPLVLSERSLILPPYTLSPGEYLVKLMVCTYSEKLPILH